MKTYFVLLSIAALITSALGFVFLKYYNLDNALLIEHYTYTTKPEGLFLVDNTGDTPKYYNIEFRQGFKEISKSLWYVFAPWFFGILVLLPISKLCLHYFLEQQITDANEKKNQAIEEQRQYQINAEKRVREAHTYEKEKLLAHYEEYEHRLNEKQHELELRESQIAQRERTAKDTMEQIQSKYKDELIRFETEKSKYTQSRNNAVHAMLRRKKKDLRQP
ncbi:hypothetical protein [Aliivibrio fischeri]|uniref:hypothetical protein n=1 Tax=Aliivibrio fischeri TaxID=668 RepID=UPI0007C51DD7|nr:hypothetical protein [Aliivibrio fischeri]